MNESSKNTVPIRQGESIMEKSIGRLIIAGITIVVMLIMVLNSFSPIKSGYVGIVAVWGAVKNEPFDAGLNFKVPLITKVTDMSIQTQKVEINAAAASKDLQTISTVIAINFHVQKEKATTLFKNVGMNYQEVLIAPAIQESVKAVTAAYSAEDIIKKRPEASGKMKDGLAEKLSEYGIIVDAFNIMNLDFSREFNAAIEAKQTAQQNVLKAQQELDRVTIEANQKVANARAEATAIAAKADADAYAIKTIQEQLTKNPDYIKYILARRWDGKQPTVVGGGGVILDLKDVMKE